MFDIVGKFLTLFLALMTLIGSQLWSAERLNTVRVNLVMAEAEVFKDKVCDSGVLSQKMIDDFYLGCSSHGAVVDIKIERYKGIVNPDGNGSTYMTYTPMENIYKFDKGDIVKIKVKELEGTGVHRMYYNMVHFYKQPLDITIPGMVRQ